MTEAAPEPTLSDVMTFLREFSGHVMAEFAGIKADVADVRHELGAVETSLRDEIRAAENRLGRRIDDVQNVVRTLKADLADHIGNPANHHRHAA